MWKNITPQLDEMGILPKIARNTLTQYCELWARWKKISIWLQEHGEVYSIRAEPTPEQIERGEPGDAKSVQQWPQVSIARGLREQIKVLEKELGLTLPAITGLTVGGKSKEKEEKGKGRFFSAG